MQFKLSLFASIMASICLASGLPSPKVPSWLSVEVPHSLMKYRVLQRQIIAGSLTICTGTEFTGSCNTLITPNGQCVDFPAGFHHDVSSLAPLEGWECDLYL